MATREDIKRPVLASDGDVWEVTANPPECENFGLIGVRYREHNHQWQVQGTSGAWVMSTFRSLGDMLVSGYMLDEVYP